MNIDKVDIVETLAPILGREFGKSGFFTPRVSEEFLTQQARLMLKRVFEEAGRTLHYPRMTVDPDTKAIYIYLTDKHPIVRTEDLLGEQDPEIEAPSGIQMINLDIDSNNRVVGVEIIPEW